jgi:hypothetical protein
MNVKNYRLIDAMVRTRALFFLLAPCSPFPLIPLHPPKLTTGVNSVAVKIIPHISKRKGATFGTENHKTPPPQNVKGHISGDQEVAGFV